MRSPWIQGLAIHLAQTMDSGATHTTLVRLIFGCAEIWTCASSWHSKRTIWWRRCCQGSICCVCYNMKTLCWRLSRIGLKAWRQRCCISVVWWDFVGIWLFCCLSLLDSFHLIFISSRVISKLGAVFVAWLTRHFIKPLLHLPLFSSKCWRYLWENDANTPFRMVLKRASNFW